MARILIRAASAAFAVSAIAAMAQTLSPAAVSDGSLIIQAKNGTKQSVQISILSWAMSGQGRPMQEIPLRGFYVAHLVSGRISSTIDGQTADRLPGEYWTIKAGEAMQVKVLGEMAVVETVTVGKQ